MCQARIFVLLNMSHPKRNEFHRRGNRKQEKRTHCFPAPAPGNGKLATESFSGCMKAPKTKWAEHVSGPTQEGGRRANTAALNSRLNPHEGAILDFSTSIPGQSEITSPSRFSV